MRNWAVNWRGRCADVFDNILSFDQLHRKEPAATLLEQFSELDQIAVLKVLERSKLALEALQSFRAVPPELLDCDCRLRLDVKSLIDRSHAAFAQSAGYPEPSLH